MDKQEKCRLFQTRFFSRQDVYGVKWYSADGTKAGYKPYCKNYGQDFCHIKLKDKVSCTECKNQEYPRISEETVWKHISGEEEHIYYMLQQDGTIRFSAIDFDYKPGKEEEGYTWIDVQKITTILDRWGIPYGVARSTGLGFHIYSFYDDFVPAAMFRAVVFEAFEQAGFMEELRQGIRPIPEVFPKQARVYAGGIGNGIKPPMIEKNFEKGRNCFVNGKNEVIKEQWKFLANIKLATKEQLQKIITELNLDVEATSPNTPVSDGLSYQNAVSRNRNRGAYQPPMAGYIEKVLEGCTALRELRDRCAKGIVPKHDEGFALYHIAMWTIDGIDWFNKNVPGWGKTDADRKQLEYSIQKNYGAYTCRVMQEKGVCAPGTKCFDKKPPKAIVEGKLVTLKDVPKDKWPEPSPIRYAHSRAEDYLKKLIDEVDSINRKDSEENKIENLKKIIERSKVFDGSQQNALKEYIKAKKLIKVVSLNGICNKAEDAHKEKLKENARKRDDVISIQGIDYQRVTPFGYSVLKIVRNKYVEIQLCDCDITIEEEQFTINDDGEIVSSFFNGSAKAKGIEKSFSIEVEKWYDASEFVKYFGILLGTHFNILRQNVDHLRQASIGFSLKEGIERVQKLCSQGWYSGAFVMPSVVVDKNGPHPNTERYLDIGNKAMARNLDFSLLNDDEFNEVAFHIKNEFMNAWPRPWTMIALAHTLLPVTIKALGIDQKPTLYFEGDSGCGKSELVMMMQQFYGNFNAILDLTSTGKGVLSVSHDFKDCLLAVDDYKGLDKAQKSTLSMLIQYSYNYSTAIKLRRDSSQQPIKEPKALLAVTGEQFISNEISMISRCILIETATWDTRSTRDLYRKVLDMSKKYNGMLPRFLQWFLNQDIVELRVHLYEIKDRLYDMHAGQQNSDRVSLNIALNYISWEMWTEFLYENGLASAKEKEELKNEHWENCITVQESMLSRCGEEMTGTAFQRVLHQIVITREVVIEGLVGFECDNKPVIGFIPKEGPAHVAYLYPDLVYRYVKLASRENPINTTLRAVGRQLMNMGVICDRDKDHVTKQIRYDGIKRRVWVVNLQKLGFSIPHLVPVSNNSISEPLPDKDSSGIY